MVVVVAIAAATVVALGSGVVRPRLISVAWCGGAGGVVVCGAGAVRVVVVVLVVCG